MMNDNGFDGEVGRAFHWRDGMYFKRREDGAVIQFRKTGVDEAKLIAIIDPNSWASIVSSVSAGGETGERYQAALDFHGGGAG